MRKKLIGIMILLMALSFLTIGILLSEFTLINPFYQQMVQVP